MQYYINVKRRHTISDRKILLQRLINMQANPIGYVRSNNFPEIAVR